MMAEFFLSISCLPVSWARIFHTRCTFLQVHTPSAHCTLSCDPVLHGARCTASFECTLHTFKESRNHTVGFVFTFSRWIFIFVQYWTMLSFVLQVNTKVVVSVNSIQVNEIAKCPKQASGKRMTLSPINVWFLEGQIHRGGKRQEPRKRQRMQRLIIESASGHIGTASELIWALGYWGNTVHQILKSRLIEKLNYNIQQMTFHIDIERETFYDAVFKCKKRPARAFAQQDFLCSGLVTVRQIFARKIREHRNLCAWHYRTFLTLPHTKFWDTGTLRQ